MKTIFSLYLCAGTWSQAMHVILHMFTDLSYNKISSLQKTSERCPLFMGNPATCFLLCLLMGCLSQLAPYTWRHIRAVLWVLAHRAVTGHGCAVWWLFYIPLYPDADQALTLPSVPTALNPPADRLSHFVLHISGITPCAAQARCRPLSVPVCAATGCWVWLWLIPLPCCFVLHVDVQLQIYVLLAVPYVTSPIFSGACRAFLVCQHCREF